MAAQCITHCNGNGEFEPLRPGDRRAEANAGLYRSSFGLVAWVHKSRVYGCGCGGVVESGRWDRLRQGRPYWKGGRALRP